MYEETDGATARSPCKYDLNQEGLLMNQTEEQASKKNESRRLEDMIVFETESNRSIKQFDNEMNNKNISCSPSQGRERFELTNKSSIVLQENAVELIEQLALSDCSTEIREDRLPPTEGLNKEDCETGSDLEKSLLIDSIHSWMYAQDTQEVKL